MRKSLLVLCSLFALSIFAPAVAQAGPVDLVLDRINYEPVGPDENAIHGDLSVNNKLYCNTLENYKFLMPAGEYKITLRKESSFGDNWPEINITGHKYVHIHAGNWPDNSKGCILLGDYDREGHIINSTPYVNKLVDLIRKDDASGKGNSIRIRNVHHVEPNTHTYRDDDSGWWCTIL